MNTEELLQFVRLTHRQAHQRFGQALFNVAAGNVHLAALAESVVGTLDDPYESNNEAAPVTQQFIARIREILG